MDSINELPKVDNHDVIFVIIDQFSKYVIFLLTQTECKAENIMELFL